MDSKVLNPCEIPIISSKTKTKNFPQKLIKSWVVTQSALGGFAREEEIEDISNGGGRGNELVNSMIPHYAIYIPSGRRIVG
jgi:hypothetical protein